MLNNCIEKDVITIFDSQDEISKLNKLVYFEVIQLQIMARNKSRPWLRNGKKVIVRLALIDKLFIFLR